MKPIYLTFFIMFLMLLRTECVFAGSSDCVIQKDSVYSTSTRKLNIPGLVGELHFPNECDSRNVVITLGGSEGGVPSGMADLFAARGFIAVALGYFGAPGLPKSLDQIPLEYFENAVLQISKINKDAKCCVIVAASKGAEGALAYATTVQAPLRGLILLAPADRAFGGLDENNNPTGNSAWTYKLKSLPFTPYIVPDNSLLKIMFPQGYNKPPVLKEFYEATMAAPYTGTTTLYPVEKTMGPILLLSGLDDHLWPSSTMAANIQRTANANGFPFAVESYSYPNAGHVIIGGDKVLAMDPYNSVWLGGTIAGSQAASTDAWEKISAFLQKAFR